jgi:hypothetical protein
MEAAGIVDCRGYPPLPQGLDEPVTILGRYPHHILVVDMGGLLSDRGKDEREPLERPV